MSILNILFAVMGVVLSRLILPVSTSYTYVEFYCINFHIAQMKFSFETWNDDNKQTYKRCSETIGSWELEAGAVVLILNPITNIPQSRLFASTGWQRDREVIYFGKNNGIPPQLVPNWVFMTWSHRIELLHCPTPLPLQLQREVGVGWDRYTQHKTGLG